ncbi:hypothetical protein HDZ31DRAFT_46364 [Schizophyllum fasciatum]
MANADAVTIFAEGTFEEQIQELVNFLVRNHSDEERTAFIRPFSEALKTEEGKKPLSENDDRKREIFSHLVPEIKTLGDGTDNEIEGFFNLLFSHIISLYPTTSADANTLLPPLIHTIAAAPAAQSGLKYRILTNLFNLLPHSSPLRLNVYNALLATAAAQGDLPVLQLSRVNVEKWVSEWDVTPENKSQFLKSIVDAFVQADSLTAAYDFAPLYVRSVQVSSTAEAREAAVQAITLALRLPSVFDFDPLFKLDAVVAAKDHELFPLLQVFLSGGLLEYRSWASANAGIAEKFGLSTADLEHKIRLLTLASLGFKHVGQNLPYTTIAQALDVDAAEVEKWVIDVIRAGLVLGKLSQTTKTLHIVRATARAFEREQWEALEKRLVAWKAGLVGVMEVVANARRQGGAVPVQAQVAAA